jgi:hypothetical protein
MRQRFGVAPRQGIDNVVQSGLLAADGAEVPACDRDAR